MANLEIVDPKKTFASRLKMSGPWKIFVVCFVPIFESLWAFVFHFKVKVIYIMSHYSKMGSPILNDRAAELINGDPDYLTFAKDLRENIPENLLIEKKRELLANPDESAFSMPIESYLDSETRFKILKFALSDKVLERVLPYFKIVPRLDTAFVMYNVPKFGSPEGSQLWHRDGDIYKMLSLYICLTDLDLQSGRYSAVAEKSASYHRDIPQEFYDPNKSVWKNGRLRDPYLKLFVKEADIINLEGPMGTAAYVDGSICYHKGGFCKDRDRLLFQVNFVADQTHSRMGIVKGLKLEDHREIKTLINTPLKKALVRGNSGQKGKLIYAVGRRLLSTYRVQNLNALH